MARNKHTVPVTFDKALRLTMAESLQFLDPKAANVLRRGIGLRIYVTPEDAPSRGGGLISKVGSKPAA